MGSHSRKILRGRIKAVVPLSPCPSCNKPLEGATGNGTPPGPGDYSVCRYCGQALVFGDDMKTRALTEDERKNVPEYVRQELLDLEAAGKAGILRIGSKEDVWQN